MKMESLTLARLNVDCEVRLGYIGLAFILREWAILPGSDFAAMCHGNEMVECRKTLLETPQSYTTT